MPQERSVGAIVFSRHGRKRDFLLLLYGNGHWDFPKGHIEEGETEEQAMFRELKEETGISAGDVRILPGFMEKISYFYHAEGKAVFKTVEFFLVESKHKRVVLSSEHKDYKWLPFAEAHQQATFRTAKQLLEKADSFLKQSSLKELG